MTRQGVAADYATTQSGGALGVLASLLIAISYLVWWGTNDVQANAVTIGLAAAIASLIVVSAVMAATNTGKAWAGLLAVGLWIFLVVSIGGLFAAAAATHTQGLVVTAINVRMVRTGAAVAFYAVAILAVRYRWIILPMAEMTHGDSVFPASPRQAGVLPAVSPLSDGYFISGDQEFRSKWIAAVRSADTAMEIEWMIARAYAETAGVEGLKASRKLLGEALVKRNGKSGETITEVAESRLMRQHAWNVALTVLNASASRSIFLTKVQNQLCVFTLILLGAVAVFSTLGWAAPMAVAGAAAIIFRIRDLTPIGDPSGFNGGARWMALLMTPLTGAVSAVLGLTVVNALANVGVFSTDLAKSLDTIPGINLVTATKPLGALVLGLAVAFGWSARLLDDMLKKLTAALEKQPDEKSPDCAVPKTRDTGAKEEQDGEEGDEDETDEEDATTKPESKPEGGDGVPGRKRMLTVTIAFELPHSLRSKERARSKN